MDVDVDLTTRNHGEWHAIAHTRGWPHNYALCPVCQAFEYGQMYAARMA